MLSSVCHLCTNQFDMYKVCKCRTRIHVGANLFICEYSMAQHEQTSAEAGLRLDMLLYMSITGLFYSNRL